MHLLDSAAQARLAAPAAWIFAWPAAILGAGVIAGFVFGFGLGLYMLFGAAKPLEAPEDVAGFQPWLMGLIAAAYLAVGWMFWSWSRARGFTAAVFAWRPRALAGETAFALIALAAAMYFGAQAHNAIREILPPPEGGPLVGPGTPPLSLIFAVPAVVLVGPLVEEFIFRGWMQPALIARGFRTWAAIVATATVFGLMHAFDGAGVAAYTFVLGLGAGAVRVVTGRLWAPILLHAANNALVVILAGVMAAPG